MYTLLRACVVLHSCVHACVCVLTNICVCLLVERQEHSRAAGPGGRAVGVGAVTVLRKQALFSFVNAAAGMFSAWIETQEQACVAGLVAQVQVCVCVHVCMYIDYMCMYIYIYVYMYICI